MEIATTTAVPTPAAQQAIAQDSSPELNETHEEPSESAEQVQAAIERRLRVLDHDFELPETVPEEHVSKFKEIADSLNKGWTQKNQSLAEEKRQLQAWYQAEQQRLVQTQAAIDKVAELRALETQLKSYEGVTPEQWAQWAEQDSVAAQKAFMAYQALKAKRDSLDGEVKQVQRSFEQEQQRQISAVIEYGQKVLSEKAPDLNDGMKAAIIKSLTEDYGINGSHPLDRAVSWVANMHPGIVMLARDAYLYRQSLKKASAPEAKPQPQPIAKVGTNATAAKSPDQMSMREWMEWRNKQVRRKA